MKQRDFDAMMNDWLERQGQKSSGQSREEDWAVAAGITDGLKPQAYVTRREAAVMIWRALDYFF